MVFPRNKFYLLRNLLAVCGLLGLVAAGVAVFVVAKSYNLPPRVFVRKVLQKTGLDSSPLLVSMVTPKPLKPDAIHLPALDDPDWVGQGARKNRQLAPLYYSASGRPVPELWLDAAERAGYDTPQELRQVAVATAAELLQAIKEALPGDVIALAPGTYRIDRRSIEVNRAGTAAQPIQVRAAQLGQAQLELNSLEGFLVNAPFWVFEHLDIKGVCRDHGACEHAFHMVGQGRGFVLRNSRIHEFNAMIKANGLDAADGTRVYPDGALIEGNSFFNASVRNTSSSVVPIDVVAADDWIIRENLIADYGKGRGDQISTAAFIKGNATGGVFENNLVVGEYSHSGGVRLGLSFGGGGTSRAASRHQDNAIEHTDGIVRNNVVMYTSDVGLYLNKSRNTQVLNNLLFQTLGMDVRFSGSTAVVKNNLLSGGIRERDGGAALLENNLILDGGFLSQDFADIYENPWAGNFRVLDGKALAGKGLPNAHIRYDFCNEPRKDAPDLGAFEIKGGGCGPFFISGSRE